MVYLSVTRHFEHCTHKNIAVRVKNAPLCKKITSRENLIYFPDFCQIVLDRMRNPTEEEANVDDEELNFHHLIFKVTCMANDDKDKMIAAHVWN